MSTFRLFHPDFIKRKRGLLTPLLKNALFISLVYFLKFAARGAADRTDFRGLSLYRIAAILANIKGLELHWLTLLQPVKVVLI